MDKKVMKTVAINLDEAVSLYKEHKSLHKIAKILHTSHIRLSNLFKENDIELNNIGRRKDISDDELRQIISEYNDPRLKTTMEELSKKYGVRIKKLRRIFEENGIKISKWRFHEKKVKVKQEPKPKIEYAYKHCPYCNWKTRDVDGKAHQYQIHLERYHKVDILEHLKKYPEDEPLLKGAIERTKKVRCKICGEYHWLIDDRHLKKHNMTLKEYIEKYGDDDLVSEQTHKKLSDGAKAEALKFKPTKDTFISSYEKELYEYISSLGIDVERSNRSILGGREIDLLVENKKIGFEIDGLVWHSEFFGGKTKDYHLLKTTKCLNSGYKLIHIFEDEIKHKNEVVLGRIKHLLGADENRIYARKCCVRHVNYSESVEFMNKNHVQGYIAASVVLGLYYEGSLVALMSFRHGHMKNKAWEISRYCTKLGCTVVGGASKLFKHFLKTIKPDEVISYVDRRWTPKIEDCLYGKIGMKLDKVYEPSYFYLNNRVARDERINRLSMTKKILEEKYNLPKEMSEIDMARLIGYDRIWDCGLLKYSWHKKED